MFVRLPRLALIRLMSLLLLATIGLHASEPVRELGKQRGSAFSSATVDVAVKVTARLASRTAVAPQMPAVSVLTVAPPVGPVRAPATAVPPASTGPPPFALLDGQPSPRAPPFA